MDLGSTAGISQLRGRELILGVGGGIAAYKSCDLLRRLQDHGFLITVIPTIASLNFVGKATWEALSGRPVEVDLWNKVHQVPHIAIAKKTDVIVIAPATADLISRVCAGRADDYLTNVLLATSAPVIFVPAMHPQMWLNQATVANVAILRSRGYRVVEPEVGRLTGSDSGVGRFPATATIVSEVESFLNQRADLREKKILITAGGTREPIDPVRFIGNRSSGKQGRALAFAAARRGSEVTLICANVTEPDLEGIRTIHVETASQLYTEATKAAIGSDAIIMSAAVADAKPKNFTVEKIPKSDFLNISLTQNPDILKALVSQKTPGQVFIGFAAETQGDVKEKGKRKLQAKGVDYLYVNDVATNQIFGSDDTQGWILGSNGEEIYFSSGSKDSLANQLLDRLVTKLG